MVVKVAFIGAGEINFGSLTVTVPWNHAQRIETAFSKHGIPLEIVGISDINLQRAQQVLAIRKAILPDIYQNTQVFSDYVEMLNKVQIDAAFIGLPPFAHGSSQPGLNAEIECAKRSVHMFVEKPLSCSAPEEVLKVKDQLSQTSVVSSVGYMFRYSKVMDKLREVIGARENIKLVSLRYNSAYTAINKSMWWNMKTSGGPIVEQSTHFIDLARFLAGDVDISSVQAFCIPPPKTDLPSEVGHLNSIPKDAVTKKNVEEGVSYENRIPRATNAIWRFENGTIASLSHAALLHGCKYECELEVWGDGLRAVLQDPYTPEKCVLRVKRFRKPNETAEGHEEQEIEEEFRFPDDDPYETEIVGFLSAVIKHQDPNNPIAQRADIRSSYQDASGTYCLSWKIREEAEKSSYHK